MDLVKKYLLAVDKYVCLTDEEITNEGESEDLWEDETVEREVVEWCLYHIEGANEEKKMGQ